MPENETTWVDKISYLWETYKIPLVLAGIGCLSLIIGIRLLFNQSDKVEFREEPIESTDPKSDLIVDISGAVVNPGVYTLKEGSRIHELLLQAGGLAEEADRDWVGKYLNLATKLVDGTKIYIPKTDEVIASTNSTVLGTTSLNTSNNMININTASKSELESLPGIGPVTADKIINGRPYQAIEELDTRNIVNSSTFGKIKDTIAIY